MPDFIPGQQLNARFYEEAVRPILADTYPDLGHSAALIGYGSDVLGYDTPQSTDHNWGPRLQLFLNPEDRDELAAEIDATLSDQLPRSFAGYPVNFTAPAATDGVQSMESNNGPVRHLVEMHTVAGFCNQYLAVDPDAQLNTIDWLSLPEQRLLEITAGAVYHDGLNELEPLRARFAYFPHDVWLFRMAGEWQQISQEEAFMGRCGDVGDELGSRLVAARLVRHMMRLAFLIERTYAPYSKWLGTAFARLACADDLMPLFLEILDTTPWTAREEPLCAAYVVLGEMHNELAVSEPVEPTITLYHGRPYRVIFAGRYATALQDAITDETARRIPHAIGAVDQFVDCTEINSSAQLASRLRPVLEW